MPKARNTLYYYINDRISRKLDAYLSPKLDKIHYKYCNVDLISDIWDDISTKVDGENSDGLEELLLIVDAFIVDYIDEEEHVLQGI